MDTAVRVVISLVAVVGALWLIAKLARRPLRRLGGGRHLEVVARTALSRNASIAVVRIDERALVLGVTDGGITLVGEADPEQFADRPEPRLRRKPLVPGSSERQLDFGLGGTRKHRTTATDDRLTLAGSALSFRTWRQAFDTLLDRSENRS